MRAIFAGSRYSVVATQSLKDIIVKYIKHGGYLTLWSVALRLLGAGKWNASKLRIAEGRTVALQLKFTPEDQLGADVIESFKLTIFILPDESGSVTFVSTYSGRATLKVTKEFTSTTWEDAIAPKLLLDAWKAKLKKGPS